MCNDPDSHMFFEKIEQARGNPPVPFPEYIQDIITDIRERTLIYIPPVFARHLRKDNNMHEQIYLHEHTCWRMALCRVPRVGVETPPRQGRFF